MGLPSIISSTLETKLRINALSRDIEGMPVEVSYLPPMYIPTREIIFLSALGQELPIANLDIYGLPHVLKHIIVSNKISYSYVDLASDFYFIYFILLTLLILIDHIL
jgi:hypothetical protein